MSKYISKYKELGFYVDGVQKKFSNGEYFANTKKEQVVLDDLKDVVKVEAPKPQTPPEPKKETPKRPTTKKSSEK